MKRYGLPIALLALLIAAWQLAAKTGLLASVLGLEDFLVPAPSEIASALWQSRSLLLDNGWVTLREVLVGFLIAAVAGAGFAVVLHLSEVARRAFYPLLVGSQTIPPVAIAPIFIVWFGFGPGPKVALVALVSFFPITVNTLDGLRSVDPDAVKMMRSLDASRWQIFRRLEAPGALPFTFSGAKVAVAVCVIAAVFGEFAGATSGLGQEIQSDSAQLLTARVFAAIFVLSAMAIALFGLLTLLERRILKWR